MKKIIALFAAILLAATPCHAQPTDPVDLVKTEQPIKLLIPTNTGVDGYVFLAKPFTNMKPKVRIVVYKSQEALTAEAVKRGMGADTLAFTEEPVKGKTKVCTIHIVDPEVSYRPDVMGHEFYHCVYGQWHLYNW